MKINVAELYSLQTFKRWANISDRLYVGPTQIEDQCRANLFTTTLTSSFHGAYIVQYNKVRHVSAHFSVIV